MITLKKSQGCSQQSAVVISTGDGQRWVTLLRGVVLGKVLVVVGVVDGLGWDVSG
jgi:hypothetical protein